MCATQATVGATIVLLAMYMFNGRPPPRMVLPLTEERLVPEISKRPLLSQLPPSILPSSR